ncbi:hypothetical protein ABW20_dc0106222 [Dactylellina cionopaga]|nr:hypothetical protein ABW20_dc0106222 [Dactylellina cionopaga]
MSTNVNMDVDEKSDNGSSPEPAPPRLPESLIAGREKRSTAGNRLAQLLQQEQPDDIDLLFEENGEEDEDFEGKDESDVDLGSSSDEEDKPQQEDELAGEIQLEKEERASKKRKNAAGIPSQKELDKLVQRQQNLREKRVTIQEPTDDRESRAGSTQLPDDSDQAPRTRKKSERISWIPTPEDQPSRQSSRRQTVANKQLIHERMKESNERRLKVIAAMNEASHRKKEKKVTMTQEMRLERAKKVEEMNKKSLNKWQIAEETRLEVQRAKLAALHNRKIEGPFIRFYSGRAERDADGRLISIEDPIIEDAPQDVTKEEIGPIADTDNTNTDNGPPIAEARSNEESSTTTQQTTEPSNTTSVERISAVPPSDADLSDDTPHQIAEQLQGDLDASLLPPKPLVTCHTFISLEGFEKEKMSKEMKSKILFPHNRGPLPKPDRPLCVTTSLPARFKDPSTGLPYASLFGYKQIQRVKQGGLQWNNELQCFFDTQEAAAGVPEGFNI